ncbi:3-oxoacyl-ACP synthase [Mangrovimonas xylaniphaga]|uniref:3-oxoacyl-ACP synthase n=1 Tax=Mangrovimonas xylaniphaga TaxID=1645915 RepID=UPI0006B427C6|nr:3-oxoacyl-ACP synthase [Mangrovimonas xylaniphaga]
MKNKETIKLGLLQQCLELIETRLRVSQQNIQDIQESLNSETKSSAGDKHETGRAMLQLEREKAGQQLAELERTKAVLSKIEPNSSSKIIGLGSVVFTDKGNYFIAASLGELNIENTAFYAISAATPIGQLLLGKREGEKVDFGGNKIAILEII